MNTNYLRLIIIITVKDFRLTLEKIYKESARQLSNTFQWKPRGGRRQDPNMKHYCPSHVGQTSTDSLISRAVDPLLTMNPFTFVKTL